MCTDTQVTVTYQHAVAAGEALVTLSPEWPATKAYPFDVWYYRAGQHQTTVPNTQRHCSKHKHVQTTQVDVSVKAHTFSSEDLHLQPVEC